MNYHRGLRIQQGSGIGSLFSGLFRGLMPVAKSTISSIGKVVKSDAVRSAGKYLKKEATKAAIDTALEALEGKPVGRAAKSRLKNATHGILLNAARRADTASNKPQQGRKRRRNQALPATSVKRRKTKTVPLFEDDDEY